MFRRSDGSAPIEFVLVVTPLLLSFGAVISVSTLGYQRSLLTAAATTIAERAALADVEEADLDAVSSGVFQSLGLSDATASLASDGHVKVARASFFFFGFELEATGFASVEG